VVASWGRGATAGLILRRRSAGIPSRQTAVRSSTTSLGWVAHERDSVDGAAFVGPFRRGVLGGELGEELLDVAQEPAACLGVPEFDLRVEAERGNLGLGGHRREPADVVLHLLGQRDQIPEGRLIAGYSLAADGPDQ